MFVFLQMADKNAWRCKQRGLGVRRPESTVEKKQRAAKGHGVLVCVCVCACVRPLIHPSCSRCVSVSARTTCANCMFVQHQPTTPSDASPRALLLPPPRRTHARAACPCRIWPGWWWRFYTTILHNSCARVCVCVPGAHEIVFSCADHFIFYRLIFLLNRTECTHPENTLSFLRLLSLWPPCGPASLPSVSSCTVCFCARRAHAFVRVLNYIKLCMGWIYNRVHAKGIHCIFSVKWFINGFY